MSLATLLHQSLGVALDAPLIRAVSLQSDEPPNIKTAHSVLQQHFTLSSAELVSIWADSVVRALSAIDDQLNGGYLSLASNGRLCRSYSGAIRSYILDPFGVTHGLDRAARHVLCRQLHHHTVRMLQAMDRLCSTYDLPDPDMAELLTQDIDGFTQRLLERIERVCLHLPQQVYALLAYREVFGHAVLYFFRTALQQDPRVQATERVLKQQGVRLSPKPFKRHLVKLQKQQIQHQEALTHMLSTRERDHRNVLIKKLDQLDDLLFAVRMHQELLQHFRQYCADWNAYLAVRPCELQQWVISAVLPPDEPVHSATDAHNGSLELELTSMAASSGQSMSYETDVPDVHGWSKARVQSYQHETAMKLNIPVVFHDSFQDGSDAPDMVVIPPGRFLMGSINGEYRRADNERQHAVTVSQAFALGKYPVTFAQYDRFCIATAREQPGSSGWGRGSRPVINVSWYDAMAYCQWLSAMTGQTYRLPSEAEWEYACRAGTTTDYHFGDTITSDQANFQPDDVDFSEWIKDAKTTPVDQFAANPWGLYDCHGNVFEWTGSEYDKHYSGAERHILTIDADDDIRRVVRGGCWYFYSWWVHSAARFWLLPDSRNFLQGFRLARSL